VHEYFQLIPPRALFATSPTGTGTTKSDDCKQSMGPSSGAEFPRASVEILYTCTVVIKHNNYATAFKIFSLKHLRFGNAENANSCGGISCVARSASEVLFSKAKNSVCLQKYPVTPCVASPTIIIRLSNPFVGSFRNRAISARCNPPIT
jgi:hypothetical protein